MLFWESDSYLA
jgi:hypothetical protein